MIFIFALCFISIVWAKSTIPSQVHIALAGNDVEGNADRMAISWFTESVTLTTTVKYGTASGTYSSSAKGTISTYYTTFHHHAVLSALKPSTKYYYIVGDEIGGFSEEYQFTSAPLSSKFSGEFSFLTFGDLGLHHGDSSTSFIKSMKDSVNLIWHAGDIGYADDAFLHPDCLVNFCYENVYNDYMNSAEEWSSQIPYMVLPGNHEAGK
jgi:hypothetical protein